jgi:cytochrome c-type biogenesis protein CcsB
VNGQSLAELSNVLIYSSMLVLFFAMFAFAVSFAGRKSRDVDLRASGKKLQTASMGTSSSSMGAYPDDPESGVDQTAPAASAPSIGNADPSQGADTSPGTLGEPAAASDWSHAAIPESSREGSKEALDPDGVAAGSSRGDADRRSVVDPSSQETAGGAHAGEPGRRAGNIAMALTWLGFVMLLGGVIARGIWAERAPWGNMYEFSLTSALAGLGIFLAISLKKDVRWLGIFVIPVVLLMLGLAVTVLYSDAAQLVPALQSYWLVIHVSAAIVCGGAFMVAAALALLYLVSERATRPAAGSVSKAICAVGSRLPDPGKLDRLSYRLIAFSFPLWTFAVVAGAIWAESAWGRYWGWDPKETWAFITWVVYAGYLHARTTAGWRGKRAAIIAIVGFLVYVFNYFGVNLVLPGLHSYSGV